MKTLIALAAALSMPLLGFVAAGEFAPAGSVDPAGALAKTLLDAGVVGGVALVLLYDRRQREKYDRDRAIQLDKERRDLETALAGLAQRQQDVMHGLEEELRRLNITLSALYAMPEDVAARLGRRGGTRAFADGE